MTLDSDNQKFWGTQTASESQIKANHCSDPDAAVPQKCRDHLETPDVK